MNFVSMLKSAYLMVFSLMGANGYAFAENIGLQPVREQIMNPDKKILKDGFIGTFRFDSDDYRKLDRSLVFLCRTMELPFWIVPMWNDKAILLSCGATEPIDELVMTPKEADIPLSSLVGWVSRRFNSSVAIGGTVGEETNDRDDFSCRHYWWSLPYQQRQVAIRYGLPPGEGVRGATVLSRGQSSSFRWYECC